MRRETGDRRRGTGDGRRGTVRSRSPLPGLLVLVALIGVGGCSEAGEVRERPSYDPLVEYDTVQVAIATDTDTLAITAELADNDDRRAYGLMERPHLPADHGMLFVYDQAQDSTGSFWMFRTEIPLDIAFLDEAGRIVAILTMDPCESPDPRYCRHYSPGLPYQAALEVNRGFFEEHGVEPGDRVWVREADVDGTEGSG